MHYFIFCWANFGKKLVLPKETIDRMETFTKSLAACYVCQMTRILIKISKFSVVVP